MMVKNAEEKMKLLSGPILIAAIALSGCGGGNTDGGGGAVVTPPVSGGTTAAPDGSDINSVIAFAKQSGGYYAMQNDVKRYETTKTIDGTKYTAWVDSLPGIGDAVVGYRVDDNQVVYSLNNDIPTPVTALSGIYTGTINLSYRLSPSGEWRTMFNNGYIDLDLQAGTFTTDSIASNDTDTFEVFGSGTVANKTLSANDLTVRHRDADGNFLKDYTGSVGENRIVAGSNGPTNQAIIGKISSSDPDGFEMHGVFDYQYSKEFN